VPSDHRRNWQPALIPVKSILKFIFTDNAEIVRDFFFASEPPEYGGGVDANAVR
jgi:hypothetical protein